MRKLITSIFLSLLLALGAVGCEWEEDNGEVPGGETIVPEAPAETE